MNRKKFEYLSVMGLMALSSITFTACNGKHVETSNGADSSYVPLDSVAINTIDDASLPTSEIDWQGTTWINGHRFLVAEPTAPDQVLLLGKEDDQIYGFLFDVKKITSDRWNMQGTDSIKKTTFADNLVANEVVRRKEYLSRDEYWKRMDDIKGCSPLLLCYDKHGALTSIYWQSSENLQEVNQESIIQLFAGKFISADGKAYQFNTDGTCIFAGEEGTYTLDGEGAFPRTNINVNDKTYILDINPEGLLLYEGILDDEGRQIRGQLVTLLSADKNVPRWSFMSKVPCNDFSMYAVGDKEVIAMMRNEIYARHGWRFTDANVYKYFSSQNWYKPVANNNEVQLSELEQLNVDYLNYYEETFPEHE